MSKRVVFCILCCMCTGILLFTGCSNPLTGKDGEVEAGYYKNIVMQPNGEFIAQNKIDDKKAADSGLLYKVEQNDQKKMAKITAVYNEKPINILWFDTTYSYYGNFASITMEYQNGYVKYSFKDENMEPVYGYYKAYSIRYKQDEKNKKATIAYCYDKNGDQIATKNKGTYSQLLFTYDKDGVLIKVGYANANGERVTTDWKEYETNFKYDKDAKKHRLPVEITNRSKDGELLLDTNGYAKKTFKYDDKDRLTEIRYFGTDENLKERAVDNKIALDARICGIGAGAITKYSYDEKQVQPTKIAFYGVDEQPIGIKPLGYKNQMNISGIANIKLQYDEKGNVSDYSTWGTDDLAKPIDFIGLGDTIVEQKYTYDDFGNVVGISNYNKDNTLATCKSGWAVNRLKFTDRRNLSESAYFGTNEEPVEITRTLPSGTIKKYHKVIYEYDADGKSIKTTYYDKDSRELGAANANKVSTAGLNKFFGRWYMEGPTMPESVYIIFNENGITYIPMHDAKIIPQSKWKRTGYTVTSININADSGEGYAILKFDDGSVNRFVLHGPTSMTWDKYKYSWTRRSANTSFNPKTDL